VTLDIIPGNPDSATKAFADLKSDLDGEMVARLAAQIEVDVLAWAVKHLKISAEKFATQIPTLEDKVKHLENKVVDGLNEDYQKQISQLTMKLESESLAAFRTVHYPLMASCSDEEGLKLVGDSAVTARQVIHMLGVVLSLG
jgi:hypothetical protein